MRFYVPVLSLLLLFGVSARDARAQNMAARAAFAAGTDAAHSGAYAQAQGFYQTALTAIDEQPDSAPESYRARLHYNLGVCAYHLQQYADAAREYERSITLMRGKHPQGLYALGMTRAALRDWSAARTAFERSLKLTKGKDGETWFDLAMVLVEQHDFNAAHAAFAQAVKYKSLSAPAAHNNLGVIFALNGDWRTAEREFTLAAATADALALPEAARNLQVSRSVIAAREPNPARNLARLTFFSKHDRTTGDNQ